MKKIFYILSCFMLMSIFSQAQQNPERCGSDHIHTINQSNPAIVQKTADIERFTQQWIRNNQHAKNWSSHYYPIVIHVVWNDSIQNISDAQIQSQLDVLNQDFRNKMRIQLVFPLYFRV